MNTKKAFLSLFRWHEAKPDAQDYEMHAVEYAKTHLCSPDETMALDSMLVSDLPS